jgi:hypothetical protein
LSEFRLAANSFAIDQWAHLRQLGDAAAQEVKEVQDNDRRPKVGHCVSHHKEGVEVIDFHYEEGGFRPY